MLPLHDTVLNAALSRRENGMQLHRELLQVRKRTKSPVRCSSDGEGPLKWKQHRGPFHSRPALQISPFRHWALRIAFVPFGRNDVYPFWCVWREFCGTPYKYSISTTMVLSLPISMLSSQGRERQCQVNAQEWRLMYLIFPSVIVIPIPFFFFFESTIFFLWETVKCLKITQSGIYY